jgi:hypothetical protein
MKKLLFTLLFCFTTSICLAAGGGGGGAGVKVVSEADHPLHHKASRINLDDIGGYYTSTNVEDALQEVSGLISSWESDPLSWHTTGDQSSLSGTKSGTYNLSTSGTLGAGITTVNNASNSSLTFGNINIYGENYPVLRPIINPLTPQTTLFLEGELWLRGVNSISPQINFNPAGNDALVSSIGITSTGSLYSLSPTNIWNFSNTSIYNIPIASITTVKIGQTYDGGTDVWTNFGVSLTAADGILTIKGLKDGGNNENLTFDFETTANKVAIGSTTGVTGITYTGTLGITTLTHTGIKDNYRLITSADSLVATDDFVAVTGTTTITLPTAVGITGTVYTIKNTGTAIVTIDADGTETIDGALTYVIRTTNSGVQIISNGANWLVKGVF